MAGDTTRELSDELAEARLEVLGVKLELRLGEIARRLDDLVESNKGLRAEQLSLAERLRALEVDAASSKVKLFCLMGGIGLGGSGIGAAALKLLGPILGG